MILLSSTRIKRFVLTLVVVCFVNTTKAQVSGNINYQQRVTYTNSMVSLGFSGSSDIILSVKALSNIKADAYVAVFSLTQVGNTTQEVNQLLEKRIDQVKAVLHEDSNSIYTDMISFVPVYEYVVTKRLFSKRTYNEIPKGFELKKNLHIRYTDPNQLNEIISACANAEIYDIVKVDYFAKDLAAERTALVEQAQALLEKKMGTRQKLLGLDFSICKKEVVDGFKLEYPIEKYNTYQAFNSSSLYLKKSSKVQAIQKETTLYYQPVIDKEFDFVNHPIVDAPVIQLMYEIKIRIERPKKEPKLKEVIKTQTQYVLVTGSGEVKNIGLPH